MLKKLNNIFDLHKKQEAKKGGNFNICSLLRKENDEVNLHSKFIYELINPEGSHAQKHQFLKLFIEEALDLNVNNSFDNNIIVKREDLTDNDRKIDFTIETSEYIIGIEMKVDAADQKNQLSDYLKELNKRNTKYKKNDRKDVKLFYLTKFGDIPSDLSIDSLNENKIVLRSFSIDIEWWLSKCIINTNIIKLQESIKQYQEIIHKITGQLPKEINTKMDELIKNKNDIETLHKMTQNYPRFWARKEADFWNQLYSRINKMTINKISNEENNNFKIDLFCYDTPHYNYNMAYDEQILTIEQKRHHNYHSTFGLITRLIYKRSTFEISIFQSDGRYTRINIDLIGPNGATKENRSLKKLLEDNGFNSYQFKYIENPILTFYAKNVSEPTFNLFDDVIFSSYLSEYTKEIKKAIQLIEDNKSDIIQ